MGRCHDFGVEVGADCEHPMEAGAKACVCPQCDSVCEGQFKGCADVWARGPRPVEVKSSTLGNGHVAGNGQVDSALNRSAEPVSSGGALPEGRTSALSAAEASSTVVDWPETSTHGLRTELEALSTAVTHQQGVVTQLVAAYSELRRDPGQEALLVLVRQVVEDALGRHEALLREELVRDNRRLNLLADDVHDLRREYRADQSMENSGREQLRTELHNALGRQRAEISELLTAGTDRLDQLLTDIGQLTADQQSHSAAVTTSQEAFRAELHDALRRERIEVSEALATNTGVVDDAIDKLRKLVVALSTAVSDGLRDAKASTDARFSDFSEAVLHLQDAARNDRDATRQFMAERFDDFADSMGDTVTDAVTLAIGQSEDRTTKRLDRAIRGVRLSLKNTEQTVERHMQQAAQAEGERLKELQTSLAELRGALEGTHLLAAAQQEETELLDGALSTLQASLIELETSVATQHLEMRDELARHRRSSSAILKRQLSPVVSSIPAMVAAAVQAGEDQTLQRIEKAVATLRRSLSQAPSATARPRDS